MPDHKIREVAYSKQFLFWAFLASIVGTIIPFAGIVTIPVLLYCVYDLTSALELNRTKRFLYLVAMFFPLISLLALLNLNGKAKWFLKTHGTKIGLVGAVKEDLSAKKSE